MTRFYKRLILNEIRLLTEQELKDFPLSEEELRIIKRWGDLDGEPSLLGTGTMGSAYQFRDKVLKITSDYDEAKAAFRIAGKYHPNVYRVFKVSRRQERFKESPNNKYMIVYELVAGPDEGKEFPSKEAQEIIKSIHNSHEKIKYNWVDNLKELLNKFREILKAFPEIIDLEKTYDGEKKLDKIIRLMEVNEQEGACFKLAWQFVNGFYGSLKTSEIALSRINNIGFKYLNQVCSGLTFLMNNGIQFTDLKTTNVMRQPNGRLVIIDIGKSRVINNDTPIPETY